MVDYDSMSEEELEKLVKEQESSPDYDSMSEEELEKLVKAEKKQELRSTGGVGNLPQLTGKQLASGLRTIGGALAGAIPDILNTPSHLKAAYKGEEGPEFYTDKARKKIDELTGGYTKPENPESPAQKTFEFVADMSTPGWLISKAAKLAAMGLKGGSKAHKALKAIERANELSARNVASVSGGVGGAHIAAKTYLPEEREKDSWKNILIPLAGGIAGGTAASRATSKRFLTGEQKDASRLNRDIKLTKKLELDLDRIKKDQELGLLGSLGAYSKNPAITMEELKLRRNYFGHKKFKDVDAKNLEKYKELLGMNHPIYEELEPRTAGELLQTAANKRKTHKEALHQKEYGAIKNAVPLEAVIPEEMIKGHVGEHIFKDLKKLKPAEQDAVLKELESTHYLERLGNVSETKLPAMSKSQKKAIDILRESLGGKHAAFLPTQAKGLESNLGATNYHDLQSIKGSLGDKLKAAFGLLGDKRKGADKELWGQLKGVEDQFLKERFPELYREKKRLDAKYAEFKRNEAPIINKIVGSTEKPVSEADAFKKVSTSFQQKPEYLTHAQEYLAPHEKDIVSTTLLKHKARKTPKGEITSPAVAKAFMKLSPSSQDIVLSGLNPKTKKTFRPGVDSLLAKKGLLESLENTSGTSHHIAHGELEGKALHAVAQLAKGKPRAAIKFGIKDVAYPFWKANKFTDQKTIENAGKLSNPILYKKDLELAQRFKKEASLAGSLKRTAMQAASLLNHIR